MMLWVLFPIILALVSFVGTWVVYGIAFANGHVCSLSDWTGQNFCTDTHSRFNCCFAPTISASGTGTPENSLFTATINAGSFLFLLFCLFHHAHIMEKHSSLSRLSKVALVFGVIAAMGSFAAGNCNPGYLTVLHYLGAGISFLCICVYTVLLTALTRKCLLTGYEKFLFPLRIIFTITQSIATLCYTITFTQHEYQYRHLSAVFEWMLSINLELFELSYAVEFLYFSSFMISNLLSERDEQKPLIMMMS